MATRPKSRLPYAEPVDLPDIFASEFDVHDWEDWLRLQCWVDTVEPRGNGELLAHRRRAASIVLPRSSLSGLVRVLRNSQGSRKEPSRQ
jgi:hypothetical protein